MTSSYFAEGSSPQLIDWMRQPVPDSLRHSIIIVSPCSEDLQYIGTQVAALLNRQRPKARHQWHAFSVRDLWRFAGDPVHREKICRTLPMDPPAVQPCSDIDRVARCFARIGGAILEGQYAFDATADLKNSYRVCLCRRNHVWAGKCDVLLNPEDYESKDDLAGAICSAFLSWESRQPGSAGSMRRG